VFLYVFSGSCILTHNIFGLGTKNKGPVFVCRVHKNKNPLPKKFLINLKFFEGHVAKMVEQIAGYIK